MRAWLMRFTGALRLSICVLAGLGFSLAFNWPKPEWAAIASIVMNLPYLGATIERALTRAIATVVGAVLGLWMVSAFAENQGIFLGFLFLLSVACMYMGQGNFYPYSFMLGAVTALVVALPAMNAGQMAPEQVWQNALYRGLETGMGILISLTANAVIWPNYAGAQLRRLIGASMKSCRKILAGYLDDQLAARKADPALETLAHATAGELLNCGALLNFASRDTRAVRRRRLAHEAVVLDVCRLLTAVSELHLGSTPYAPGEATVRLGPALRRMGDVLGGALEDLLRAWNVNGNLPFAPDFASADAAFLANYEKTRHAPGTATPELIRLMGARVAMCDAWKAYELLRESHGAITGPAIQQAALALRTGARPPTRAMRRRRVHLAINAGMAVTAGSAVFLFTNTPGGLAIPVSALFFVVITVLIRYQPVVPMMIYMLAGSLLAGLMMYFIFPRLDGFLELALALFPGLMLWGWLMGNPRTMGPAIMACVLFVYSFDLTDHQTYNLEGYVSFIVGQIVGASVAAVFLTVFWPLLPQRVLRMRLAEFWGMARRLMDAIGAPNASSPLGAERITALEHETAALPNQAAVWLNDLSPERYPKRLRGRIAAHLAAAQSVAMQLRALEHARELLVKIPIYSEIAPGLDNLRRACAEEMAALADAFERGLPPVAAMDLRSKWNGLFDQIQVLRDAGRTYVYSAADIGSLLGFMARHMDVARDMIAARAELENEDYRALGKPYFL